MARSLDACPNYCAPHAGIIFPHQKITQISNSKVSHTLRVHSVIIYTTHRRSPVWRRHYCRAQFLPHGMSKSTTRHIRCLTTLQLFKEKDLEDGVEFTKCLTTPCSIDGNGGMVYWKSCRAELWETGHDNQAPVFLARLKDTGQGTLSKGETLTFTREGGKAKRG